MTSGCIGALTVGLAGALVCFLSGADDKEKAALDRDEARKAFEYLNRIRKEPAKFSKEIGINLENVKARPALKWNDILAKVAEEKALDINIQIHEAGYSLPKDWVKEKDQNFFESISAGTNTAEEAIRNLIIDRDLPDSSHRKQLLGITDFYSECTDIGIGFARNPKSKYRTYMSIVIARKK